MLNIIMVVCVIGMIHCVYSIGKLADEQNKEIESLEEQLDFYRKAYSYEYSKSFETKI